MTRGEGGWLLLPSAGLSPAILRQFAWRTTPRATAAGRHGDAPDPPGAKALADLGGPAVTASNSGAGLGRRFLLAVAFKVRGAPALFADLRGISGSRGGRRRVCHGAPATIAQDHSSLAFLDCPVQHLQCVLLTGSEGERPAGRFPAVHRRRGYAEQAGELGDRESALVA